MSALTEMSDVAEWRPAYKGRLRLRAVRRRHATPMLQGQSGDSMSRKLKKFLCLSSRHWVRVFREAMSREGRWQC